MPSDIEQQVSNYYRWIETRASLDVRPPPSDAAGVPGRFPIDDFSGFEPPRSSPPESKRPLVAALAAASAVVALVAGLAVASRHDPGNDTPSASQTQRGCQLPPVDPPASWDGCVLLEVYMSANATDADIDNVQSMLESRSGLVDTDQLQYLDAQASLDRARQTLVDEPDLADLLSEDNIVTIFRVVSTRAAPVDEIRTLAQDLASMPSVYDVQANGDIDPAVTATGPAVSDEAIAQPGWDDDLESVDVAATEVTAILDRDGHQFLRLPVGHADGVEVGMPVVNSNGLIGRVQTVLDDRSEVLLVTDNRYETGGDINGAPSEVYVVGNRLTGPELRSPSSMAGTVRVGDLVTTSGGSDALAPGGIPIGVIDSISTSQQQGHVVRLRLLADPTNDTELIKVLLYQPAADLLDQPATAQQPPTTG